MRGLLAWFVRLGAALRPGRRDRQVVDELNGHLELAIEDNMRTGMNRDEARRSALVALGGLVPIEEECRQRQGLPLFEAFLQDAKFAARLLRKNAAFTLLCTTIIALGVGANTAVFSVVNAVLLKPLPYTDADQIVTLSYVPDVHKPSSEIFKNIALADFQEWREQSSTFDAMAFYNARPTSVTVGSEGGYALVARTSPEFFRVFDMQPMAGRPLGAEDDAIGGRAVLVSSAYARLHFGEPSRALGQQLRMYSIEVTIVGVLKSESSFPQQTDIWFPAHVPPATLQSRTQQNYMAVGRLKPNATLAQARIELTSVSDRLATAHPDTNSGKRVRTTPLLDDTVGNARTMLNVLLGTVGILLLIACANLATLLLARATGRSQEMSARVALGATRSRIVSQLLVEGLAQALLGGAAGWLFAKLSVGLLMALAPANVPRLSEASLLDEHVLVFAMAVSVIVGVLFALPPALHVSGIRSTNGLKDQSGRAVVGGGGRRLREMLVVGEIALTVVLLLGAGLLVKSLLALQSVPLGFQPEHVLVMDTTVPAVSLNGTRANDFFSGLLSDISTLPGVTATGATMAPPGRVDSSGSYWIDHLPADINADVRDQPSTVMSVTAPGTISALGIPLVRGRDFQNSDTRDAPLVAMINQSLARQAFESDDPVGHQIFCTFDSMAPMTIVGVVGDVRQYGPEQTSRPECLMPYTQHSYNGNRLSIVVRTVGDPTFTAEAGRRLAQKRSPDVSVRTTTMNALVAAHTAAPRFRTLLVMLFAVLALTLALAGVFGVMTYAVRERSKEIGLRMALGAQPTEVIKQFLKEGGRIAAGGTLLGLALALVVTRYATSLLFSVDAYDPLTFGVVAILMLGTATMAGFIPARRATRLSPTIALRYE